MQTTRPEPPPFLQALVIWGALLASQGMIVLVSQTAMTGTLSSPDAGMGQAPASALGVLPSEVFIGAAVVSLLMAYFIPQLLLKRVTLTTGSDGKISRETMQRVLPAWLVRWALLESVTLFGFLSSMLNANPQAIYPFAGVSLIGFILSFPSERKLRLSK